MTRLRLRPHVEEYVVGWGATASREERECIAAFVETLGDGSWASRWYRAPDQERPTVGRAPRSYLPAPEWTQVEPAEGLVVSMQVEEQPDSAESRAELWVEELLITRVPREGEDALGGAGAA